MNLPVKSVVTSEEETIDLADEFSSVLKPGDIVTLYGQLGAGKTFFVKHILKNYGISNVSSPTFAIVNQYSGKYNINHFDFYRINKINELYDIGFEDYINAQDAITFIEWADLIPEIIPDDNIEINIGVNDDFSREITIKRKAARADKSELK
jgi:tRNA threonylcarbamoyladenosine biosynthesis protein TsaE